MVGLFGHHHRMTDVYTCCIVLYDINLLQKAKTQPTSLLRFYEPLIRKAF